jgi:uncharacterized repeat protein (TIGR03843 family)
MATAAGEPAPASPPALDLLRRGAITVKGRMPWSTNATFLVEVAADDATGAAIYKPLRGERPLWDFPRGLFTREVAAYLLSEALGWGLVPPTLTRDGPYGPGSLQVFVAADFEQHFFTLRERPEHRQRLMRICLFDLIANNADRKGGHCLLAEGTIYAIDHGLCFHAEPKLRTVIWDFGGTRIPRDMLDDVRRLAEGSLSEEIAELLSPDEQEALLARARAVVAERRFPVDASGYRHPWPLV